MEINSLKDLADLIALCRKQGVKSIQIGDFSLELGDAPVKQTRNRGQAQKQQVLAEEALFNPGHIPSPLPIAASDRAQGHELTEDELIDWSSGGSSQGHN